MMKNLLHSKKIGVFLIVQVMLLVGLGKLGAAIRTSTAAGGTWTSNATWIGNVAPVAGDDAIIATTGAGVVTLGATTTINNLTINAGSSLSVNTRTFSINGTFINNGTVTGTTSQSTIAGVFTNAGTITLSSGRLAQAGTADFTNSGTITFTGGGRIYFTGNVTNSGTLTLASSEVRFTGSNAAASTCPGFTTTGLVNWGRTAGSVVFTGNVNGAGLTINGSGGTLNLGVSLTHTFTGTWNRTAGTLDGGSSTINFTASGSVVSGTGGTFTPNAGTVNYARSGTQTVGELAYNNLILSGSGAKTFAVTTIGGDFTLEGTATVAPSAAVTFGGSVTLGSGTTFTAGAFTHNLTGNWINNGGTFTNTGSTINFNGTAQSIGGSSGTTFNNLTLSGSGTKTFNQATTIGATLSIASGAVADLGSITAHTADALTLNGFGQTSGTWGSTASTASNTYNTYFESTSTGLVTVNTSTARTITTTGTLSAFSSCNGIASTPQNFTVSGTNLAANILVTAPTGYEVSTTSGSGYANTVTLTQTGGTVTTTTIYVRLTSSASDGASGDVACTSTGATTMNVSTGIATVNASPTISGVLAVVVGSSTELTGTGTPASSSPWTSSATGVATVDNNGLVTGVAAGSSTITYTNINGCQATTTVNVIAPSPFTNTTPGSSTFTVPAGVTQLTIESWGGGGGGGNSNNTSANGGTGGGGAGYSKGIHTVVAGSPYYLFVGSRGNGAPVSSTTNATAGEASWFNATPNINSAPATNTAGTLANGGGRGVNNSTSTPSNAAATGLGNDTAIGGNNGAAGTSSGGGNGGNGANGGTGGSANSGNGNSPGGGGAGSNDATNSSGGNGANGQVIIRWTACTPPLVSAGSAFTKTCTTNSSGATIGEANDATATYSWSPATGLSSATVSNPTANPSVTTTYTVTKTTTANGCTAEASVTVTVNTTAPTVSAGSAFSKTCSLNPTGAAIGEANDATATYSWSPATGLSSATVSNPTANPSVTTTYTVTKTTTANGCTAQASVTVTVNTTAPSVNAGSAFTKTCTTNTSGATIGEANDATATYSWSPATGLSSETVSNPTANPAVTTTYTVTKTNTANGCTAQASVTVTVNTTAPTANIEAGSPTTFCEGESVTLTSSAGSGYLWSNGEITGSIIISTSGSYTVRVTGENGCQATSASTTITVHPIPLIGDFN